MDLIYWQHIMDGDRRSYESLYVEYFKKFHNYGRRFTPDPELIEDSIQELFLDVWTRRQKMRSVAAPNQYLFSSFRYILFKKIRQARQILPEGDREEPEFSIDTVIIRRETDEQLHRALQAALDQLTSRQREAIFLRFYEGLSYEEVSAVLNISVKATYKIMARSLQSLKEHMILPASLLLFLLSDRSF